MNKIKLFNNISALHKMNVKFGKTKIYIKRDDTLDFAYGGNKVRLFEYIAALAVRLNVEKLITFGSIYSNHIRVAVAVANFLGISCDLIILLKEDQEIISQGNFKLINFHKNVRLLKCPENEAHDFIDFYLEAQKNCDEKFLWIPGGGHMPEAILGYADAAKEIRNQLNEMSCKIDAIFLPTGTGTTQAGLIYELGGEIPVYGVTVARTVERCKKEISTLFDKIDFKRGGVLKNFINVLSNNNIGYGRVVSPIKNIITQVSSSDGIYLDPIYNAKAFYIMSEFLNKCNFDNVLYVNTGGSPNIFLT